MRGFLVLCGVLFFAPMVITWFLIAVVALNVIGLLMSLGIWLIVLLVAGIILLWFVFQAIVRHPSAAMTLAYALMLIVAVGSFYTHRHAFGL